VFVATDVEMLDSFVADVETLERSPFTAGARPLRVSVALAAAKTGRSVSPTRL
jgi:hypothetical protein